MAIITELALTDAHSLGAHYGLEVSALRGILAGSVNSNFELTVTGGARMFLRVYEEQTIASAKGEAALLAHLATRGVRTPCPLFFKGDPSSFIAEHAGKPVALFPWIGGASLCQSRVTPEAARQVGAALGQVHAAGASFEGAVSSRFGPVKLAERIARLRALPLEPALAADVERIATALAPYAERAPGLRGSGVCHGDLFRDNVLWEDGVISALLDFESASHESYPFDLMVTLLAWCFGDTLDRTLCRALIEGYRASRPLPDEEVASLYAEGIFAALRFAVTRLTDFELRPRGSNVHKDYRRFLARKAALAALGPGGLPTFLGL